MSTRALETQYDQLVKKSCLNQVNISKVSNEIHAIIGKIENFEVENLKLQNVDIVNKSHCVEVPQSDVEYYTKLRDQQRRKNCAMRKAIKNLETKTFESLNDLTKQLSAYYTKTKPEQIQAIHENIRNTLSTENEQRRLQKEISDIVAEEKIVQGELSKLKIESENLDEELFDLKVVLMEESQTVSTIKQKRHHIALLKTQLIKQKKRHEQLQAELHKI